ncbi:hypothetical protein HAX54_016987 [Datura stramonium]|uniref:AMP-binding enzyme C-terminal domain-containing protein n=1 Tax=Datura stramonium TaxID=4076 RepID=A0ABS8UJZ0_DATST|nr:hypothetical protein [Datura stramonium]
MQSVPRDGITTGKYAEGKQSIMKGDMGVIHPDGYLEIKDRCKDVTAIRWREHQQRRSRKCNTETSICSRYFCCGYAILGVGESPCAFVILRKDSNFKESDIIAHCRKNLPGFMVPKKVQFVEELPKTGTGKCSRRII